MLRQFYIRKVRKIMKYDNIRCEKCNELFKADDDIVVCPDCGAPYHRECYQSEGKCVHADTHGTDEQWTSNRIDLDELDKESGVEDDTTSLKCKVCDYSLRENARFCDRCGAPVGSTKENYQNDRVAGIVGAQYDQIDLDEEIADGVKLKEAANYVKVNKPYYVLVFSRIKRFKMSRFNFCAFLFTGGWFMYRKQYAKGIILALVVGALIFLSNFIYIMYSQQYGEVFYNLLNEGGNSSFTMNQMLTAAKSMGGHDFTMLVLPYVVEVIRYVLMFVVGAKANKMYMNGCIKDIQKIKNQGKTEAEIAQEIDEKGGVNTGIAWCMLACYFLLTLLPSFLMK